MSTAVVDYDEINKNMISIFVAYASIEQARYYVSRYNKLNNRENNVVLRASLKNSSLCSTAQMYFIRRPLCLIGYAINP